MTGLTINWS